MQYEYLAGVLSVADSINVNGRCYPKVIFDRGAVPVLHGRVTAQSCVKHRLCCYVQTVLRKEAQRFHRDNILTGKAFGSFDHPAYSSPSYSIVDPATASHQVSISYYMDQFSSHYQKELCWDTLPCMQILAIWWRGTALHGMIRLLDSEAGHKARGILVDTGRLGASTRCWSSLAVSNRGTASVHEDCRLIT